MHRLTVDWPALIAEYVQAGGDALDVLEKVDGFHPSQTGNQLLAGVLWADILANKPGWIKENPNNAAIIQQFGAQLNGY